MGIGGGPKIVRLPHLLLFFFGFTFGKVPISTSFHRKVHLLEQGGAQVVPLHPAMEDSWCLGVSDFASKLWTDPTGSPRLLKDV